MIIAGPGEGKHGCSTGCMTVHAAPATSSCNVAANAPKTGISKPSCARRHPEVDALTLDFLHRWQVEEFFNAHQALGWNRAGTANLHIRYGQMTMALLAQAAIHQLRTRLGEPVCSWDANHLAKDFFRGLEGDVRVQEDTIIVTYYHAPNEAQLRAHYESLPHRLWAENLNPQVPWLYGFKLDFRFR